MTQIFASMAKAYNSALLAAEKMAGGGTDRGFLTPTHQTCVLRLEANIHKPQPQRHVKT